eukprot:CAMPEP_0204325346 /NCGR_PEP_ID=MMETSP0469-20131031/10949_1 /ASSEMBLY_ACC=CAM_ASM_000384 /TAXON_ID=2969 /ORGANISM="Oxyrrhis marina" /LENGTH=181 /DNA_ID=CAMNT_0051307183 /DNA_START=1 /DNA_END=546 /DNA_ORIENTATION=+
MRRFAPQQVTPQEDEDDVVVWKLSKQHQVYLVAAAGWLWLWSVTGYDKMMFIISALVLLFTKGLGNGAGGFSGYSVFNPGGRHLMGEFRAAQFEGQMRNGHVQDEGQVLGLDGDTEVEEEVFVKSKDANKLCWCGSDKKAKKCCAAKPKTEPSPQPPRRAAPAPRSANDWGIEVTDQGTLR